MAADYAARARPDVSFEEVAALFSFPMAEASAALGVTTNDLKRICRENGVTRWPYRKILAGKSVDDIKKEAAKEKALMEREAQALHLDSHPAHLNKSRAFNLAVPAQREHVTSETLRRQTGGPAHGYSMHSSALRPLHIDHRSHLHNQFQLRANIPTYLDDFRHGFPGRGLPVSSTKWWGNLPTDKKEASGPDRKEAETKHTTDEFNNGRIQSGNEPQLVDSRDDSLPEANREREISEESMPASILTRTRKTAVVSGRKVVGSAVTRGYGTYQLADKDKALLKAIFADSLPSLWQAAMSD